MTYDEATAETFRRLLLMFEGVTIDRLRTHPGGSASAVLRIDHPASVARFACWAQNTNVAFHVWGESWGQTEGSGRRPTGFATNCARAAARWWTRTAPRTRRCLPFTFSARTWCVTWPIEGVWMRRRRTTS
jgi:hypothetical protein